MQVVNRSNILELNYFTILLFQLRCRFKDGLATVAKLAARACNPTRNYIPYHLHLKLKSMIFE